MKKISLSVVLVIMFSGFASRAHADLQSFLKNVNVQAQADIGSFNVKLSTQFGVPVPRVEAIVKTVAAPADAFMILQLGQMAHAQPEAVMQTYQRGKGKGWGALAQELGIKPGSPEFHALKRGDLSLTGQPGGGAPENGHGHGHGKGHGGR